jgi:16S rRNA C967 or C1407 C5-methylase (RsmB/RsmF family)/NOL1/NOP2/fmu family ribosome biogenesis protein
MMHLPDKFVQRMSMILGDEFDLFLQSLEQDPKTSIRINPAKYEKNVLSEASEYCGTVYFLPERPIFTIDPFFHSGAYYVQESSSMFLEQAIKQPGNDNPVAVLDLCASPGGKSTHLAALLSPGTLLVSNDVIRSRAQVLSENLKKWGSPNVIVTNNDPKDFARLEGFFDVIAVDAPCSGEGLFRRDEKAIAEWSEPNAQLCAQRQKRILADVWPALKDGGLLIYSTCTFNPEENEENIKWLDETCSIDPVELEIKENWGITITKAGKFPCYRFYPHKAKGEGFFISVIRKTNGKRTFSGKTERKNLLQASKQEKQASKFLIRDEDLEMLKFGDSLLSFPSGLMNELLAVRQNLRIIHAGIKTGELIDQKILPAHELALSPILNRDAFPEFDLTFYQALNFLKKEELKISLPQKGWNLLSYRQIPLGWVKNIGSRLNSAFPKEWRIRMSLNDFSEEKLNFEKSKFPL